MMGFFNNIGADRAAFIKEATTWLSDNAAEYYFGSYVNYNGEHKDSMFDLKGLIEDFEKAMKINNI